jgi:hypothetical protein
MAAARRGAAWLVRASPSFMIVGSFDRIATKLPMIMVLPGAGGWGRGG